MNVFCFTGNLGRDAELRHSSSGAAVAGFSVAVTAGYGERKQTLWIGCSLWGKRAESGLMQYLKKGQQVAVSGELSTREYEGKTYLEVNVSELTLAGKRDDSVPSQSAAQRPPARPAASAVSSDLDDDVPF